MIEFGSDYHYIAANKVVGNRLQDFFPSANYYADGRQALIHLCQNHVWRRLWIPSYYCYEVITSLKNAGINLQFYEDWPEYTEEESDLPLLLHEEKVRPTDAILRVNYFGLRSLRRTRKSIGVTVIEDHTHDLLGEWALNSNADWCIASLRKTLPIPEGGVLWSPLGLELPKSPESSDENEVVADTRWEAMKLKSAYLSGCNIKKASFRERFVDTEDYFDKAEVCALDRRSREYLEHFDLKAWYDKKRENWSLLNKLRRSDVQVLIPESKECYPFSLVLLFDTKSKRDWIRKVLIENNVYPAVLWDMPESVDNRLLSFSGRMLSIHCDARYDSTDIQQMKSIIESNL